MKQLIYSFTLILLTVMLFSCSGISDSSVPAETEVQNMTAELATGDANNEGEVKVTVPAEPFSIDLEQCLVEGIYKWEFVDNGDDDYYKLTEAVYTKNAKYYEWSTTGMMGVQNYSQYVQSLNIFVPAGFVNGIDARGSLIFNNSLINGYSVETAPIIFENNNAGYLSGLAGDIVTFFGDKTEYMANGFIYVNTGSRGRDIAGSPASIVDLKAGIRYIRANKSVLPGDTEKIVSVGTSGGGALSSLVGATGNMDEYYSYLFEQGAAGIGKDGDNYISTINDDVYAAQLYCPIADIENADLAYAWMRYDSALNGEGDRGYTFTAYQEALEAGMADAYVAYFNSLDLNDIEGNSMELVSEREGSYYDSVLNEISKAFNAFVDAEAWKEIGVSETFGSPQSFPYADMNMDEWIEAMYGDTDSWLVKNSDGSFSVTGLAAYLEGIGLNRNKDIPGFDDLNKSKEGNAFSSNPNEYSHFSQSIYNVMLANDAELSQLEGYSPDYLSAYYEANSAEIINQVYLYSAMQILADENKESDVATFWRMRNGTSDEHTSFSVNYNIALTLLKYVPGVDIDYALVWNMPHGANEGNSTGTLVDWVNEISK